MKIEFDLDKSDKNHHERGLSFGRAAEFDWDTALYVEDLRYSYPERRFVAMGYLGKVTHYLFYANQRWRKDN